MTDGLYSERVQKRRLLPGIALVILAVTLAACGGDGGLSDADSTKVGDALNETDDAVLFEEPTPDLDQAVDDLIEVCQNNPDASWYSDEDSEPMTETLKTEAKALRSVAPKQSAELSAAAKTGCR